MPTLRVFDYARDDLDYLLSYLVRINLIHRWAALDPARGRRMLDALMASFSEAGRRTGEGAEQTGQTPDHERDE